MTLDKHKLDGIDQITAKTLPTKDFEALLLGAGYQRAGSAPAKGNRVKVWWNHPTHRPIEAIYSPMKLLPLRLTMSIRNYFQPTIISSPSGEPG